MHAERILSFGEARALVAEHAAEIRPATAVTSADAVPGLVLAEDVFADRDYPPFHRATRDGYAVIAGDMASPPANLKLVGQIKAGSAFTRRLERGECAEIMTGAPVPDGADAVVMVEHTERHEQQVRLNRAASAGQNIVPSGSEAQAGQRILEAGQRLAVADLAVLATVGKRKVRAFARPRVAILSTGDEVVPVEQTPGPTQIRNSNAVTLAAQVTAAGGEPVVLPIAPDEPRKLRELIERGLGADLLLLSGGVSMGRYDLVEEVLTELGAEFIFTGVLIQPGKPLVFGQCRGKYFFGLPGNPISTMVTFELFARLMVDALGGASPRPLPFAQAKLTREFKTATGLTRFLPARLAGDYLQPTVDWIAWKGSGDVFAQSRANCLLVVPPDRDRLEADEIVSVLPV